MDLNHTIIRSNPYFSSLSEKDYLNLLDQITVVTLLSKEILFHEGDFAEAFYIVKEGAIQIITLDIQGNTVFLARISEGGFFGEQAFSVSSSARRQATAIAQVPSTLYRIPREFLLSLKKTELQFEKILKKESTHYIKEKLQRLASSLEQHTNSIESILNKKQFYPTRSIIYFENEAAEQVYILISGEVELRFYDEKKQLKQITSVNPGQLFGSEAFATHKNYACTAIVKHDANVWLIDAKQTTSNHRNFLEQLYLGYHQQFNFKNKSKIIQFRSEYLDMPSLTSLISLRDGREIISQQVMSFDILFISIAKSKPTRKIQFKLNENFSRELLFKKNTLIGFLDMGLWEDSDQLLDCLIEEDELNEQQIEEFTTTGHITFKEKKENDNELVCKCMRVSYAVINRLITKEHANFAEISRKTGAGSVCGACKPLIMELLGTDVWRPCLISKVITHNSEVKSFQLQPVNHEPINFKSGQYIIVKVKINNVWIQRSYTLTTPPAASYLEITVKKQEHGVFSKWLFDPSSNDQIVYVAGPYGQFTLDKVGKNPIVCFMGGIGITPAIAFLRYYVSSHSRQKIYVDYSTYEADQIIFQQEFASICKDNPNIIIKYRVTNEEGRLTVEEIEKIISELEGCHVYVCAPKGLDNLVIQTFNKMQLSLERLHIEEFIHAGAPENIPQTISLD